MMSKLCSFELSLKAKELGYDEGCDRYYRTDGSSRYATYYDITPCNTNSEDTWYSGDEDSGYKFICTAPTLDELQRWIRLKHNVVVWVMPFHNRFKVFVSLPNKFGYHDPAMGSESLRISIADPDWSDKNQANYLFPNWESALHEGLNYAIQYLGIKNRDGNEIQ